MGNAADKIIFLIARVLEGMFFFGAVSGIIVIVVTVIDIVRDILTPDSRSPNEIDAIKRAA